MLDPNRTIGGMAGNSPFRSIAQNWGNQNFDQLGERFDISRNGGPLGMLGQLFGGGGILGGLFGRGNWWKKNQGEQPGNPTPQAPPEAQYSADRSNPIAANILGASRSPTGMTTLGSMLGRQPTL